MKALERKVYDDLYMVELTRFMEENAEAYDVVISADTLCYFGELGPVFRGASGTLRQGGLFAFTLEDMGEDDLPLRLNSSGRYAHNRKYVTEVLHSAGFKPRSFVPVILRNEGKEPVAGHLVVAGKQ